MSESRIHRLSTHLANQIAAGEVVQRPASAVKELAENAIDSGATHVTVIVKQAGKQLIHLIDNGHGMNSADLAMCVERHTTSKLSVEGDLQSIRTLGFRGEALASIASIADVEIRTREQDAEAGFSLVSRPSTDVQIKPATCDAGTQIFVRNLFYNVPARRKFLKTDLTEFRYVSEVMQKIALSRPDIRFTFYDGDVLVFDVQVADLKRRILDILSINASRQLVSVEGADEHVSVIGFVGLPSISRQSRSGQFFFLNGRSIQSRALGHAVASSYEHLLNSGQHPVFVLNISIDPSKVDVNVHPQKHEVKFEDERRMYNLVQENVAKALSSANVIPSFLSDVPLASQPLTSLPTSSGGPPTIVNRVTGEIHTPMGPGEQHFGSGVQSSRLGIRRPSADEVEFLFTDRREEQPVLQAGSQYIITSSSEGIMVIDQHAAHERVVFERALTAQHPDARSEQALLFSVTVQCAPSRIALITEYQEELSALGFRLELHGRGQVEVHSVPSDVQPGNEDVTLSSILDELEHHEKLPKERRREGVAAAYAARQAVRRGEMMTQEQMKSLVSDLFSCTIPHLTPQGQPTYIVIPFDEFVQRFR